MADMRAMEGHSHLTILNYLFGVRRVRDTNDNAELTIAATIRDIQVGA
jgi:hypothetical protein